MPQSDLNRLLTLPPVEDAEGTNHALYLQHKPSDYWGESRANLRTLRHTLSILNNADQIALLQAQAEANHKRWNSSSPEYSRAKKSGGNL